MAEVDLTGEVQARLGVLLWENITLAAVLKQARERINALEALLAQRALVAPEEPCTDLGKVPGAPETDLNMLDVP